MGKSGAIVVAALDGDMELTPLLQAELGDEGTVRRCETPHALAGLVGAGGVDVTVVGVHDHGGGRIATTVRLVRAQARGARIVLQLVPAPPTIQQLPAAFEAGAAEVAVRGHDRLGDIVRAVAAPGWKPAAVLDLLRLYKSLVPDVLSEFAVACAVKASPRLTLPMLTHWLRITERTLRNRLQRASLCPPSVFLEYATAVHAGCLLARHGLTISAVVKRLGFADGRALTRLLRRYAGRSAREMRQHGRLDELLARHEAVLRDRSSRLDGRLVDRYLANELTAVERVRFEQWLVSAPPEVVEELAQLRLLLGERGDPNDLQRRKREVWARLRQAVR